MTTLDLREPRAVHVIGVGGAGMAAIAEVLHTMGHRVSGSDLRASSAFERLRGLGLDVVVGHSADNVGSVDIVTRSTAIPDSNPEVIEVASRGQAVLSRSEMLSAICALRRTVAVAGTHGKTTTSAMLSVIALRALVDPSFIVGGDVTELGTGSRWGEGEWFVVEADESDGTFVELGHEVGLVTNVEPDHLEHYGGEEPLRAAFERFVSEARTAVVCVDDPGAARLTAGSNVVTYGMAAEATYRMSNIERGPANIEFDLALQLDELGRVRVAMAGMHNARNAVGAVATALEMGLPFEAARNALADFGGVGRRFQQRGVADGVTFIDDYAHLPTEVASALHAADDTGHERIVAVFQPHRYSRTEALWQGFTDSFDRADMLIITGIYGAGEAPRPGVSGELIVEAVRGGAAPPETIYVEDRRLVAKTVAPLLKPGDLCLTLGAGDLVELPDELIAELGGRS